MFASAIHWVSKPCFKAVTVEFERTTMHGEKVNFRMSACVLKRLAWCTSVVHYSSTLKVIGSPYTQALQLNKCCLFKAGTLIVTHSRYHPACHPLMSVETRISRIWHHRGGKKKQQQTNKQPLTRHTNMKKEEPYFCCTSYTAVIMAGYFFSYGCCNLTWVMNATRVVHMELIA